MAVAVPWRRVVRSIVPATVLLLVAGVGVLAALADGYPTKDVDLHDGGVWVTKGDEGLGGLVGRFVVPSEELDVAVAANSTSAGALELWQDDRDVFVSTGNGLLRRLDPVDVTLPEEGARLPDSAGVALGGGVLAVVDPSDGRLWVRSTQVAQTLDTSTDPEDATVGGDAAVTVGRDGVVHAVSGDADRLVTVRLSDGTPVVTTSELGVQVSKPSITAVGDRAVVLSGDGRVVVPGGGEFRLPGEPAQVRLQQAGGASDIAAVATEDGLYGVPLGGGELQVLSGDGSGGPAAPVQVSGCIYAAWSVRPTMARLCPGGAALQTVPLDAPNLTADQLEFRVNHDLVVLNQLGSGALFTYDRAGDNLGNWDNVRPPDPVEDPDTDPNSEENRPPQENTDPVAGDDEYGARPGQATLLPVLENDGDADGDIIIVTGVSGGASGARVSQVANGQALQLVLPPDAAGIVRFRYTINDGRGGEATGQVTVTVRERTENSPPEPVRRPREASVEQGGSVTFHVLTDWRDPDGDPLVLAGASTNGQDQVRFTPDGFVTFVDADVSSGRKTVKVLVSDGREQPSEGTLIVNVLAHDTAGPPQPRDDRVVGFAGAQLTIEPLLNDYDPNTSVPGSPPPLWLSNVIAPAGGSASYDAGAGRITFKASQPRTYYLTYEVTQGNDPPVTARIRIDIQAASARNAPVAVADTVVLHGTGAGVVDVLANDTDLDGDVLVVSSVTVPDGLVVSVLEHRWLRVVAPQAEIPEQAIEYTVTDGVSTDTGVVTASRLTVADNQAPTPRDDVAQVRVGDVVSIDVLNNDVDPEGGLLTLGGEVIADTESLGEWYVTGDTVSYQAPLTAGTAVAHYRVLDPEGRPADGRVTVNIVDRDPALNQAPAPATLQARVFAGTVTRIHVPLSGVDVDGDSVRLLGPVAAPQLGRIVGQGIDYLDYEAYPGKGGTDEFEYQVRDRLGLSGTGNVRIGVVPRPGDNSAPVAVDDDYEVAPGATVNAPVLANDSDVDGDPLVLEPLTVADPAIGDRAQAAGGRVVLTAPATPGEPLAVQYAVTDGRGLRSFATLRVVARQGANVAPTAEDDWVRHFEAGAAFVDVAVLDNDDDIDGPRNELTVEVVGDGTEVPAVWDPATRLLRVTLGERPRQIAYRLTDSGGATATAFVHVPPAGDQAPFAREDVGDITITGGTQLPIEITDYIMDAEGGPIRLTSAEGISVSPQPGLTLVDGSLQETSLTLQADVDYSGPASLVVEVVDGTLTEGRRASVTLNVTVTPADGRRPTVACPPVQPRAGAPAIGVDLRTCVLGLTPLQREALTFSDPSGAPAGVTAERDGTRLQLRAARDAEPGATGTLRFTIGGPWGTLDATMQLTVQAAPLARANADIVAQANAGQPTEPIDVTANDFNPFPGEPLTVPLVLPASRDVSATVQDGHLVTITPDADFFGTATVLYRLQDALGDPARIVEGTIIVHVIARPDPPGTPRQVSVGSERAVVSFTAPDGNGSEIEQYQVQDQSGRAYDCGRSTTCELRGLINGRGYQFQARARNAVDWSPWSAPSQTITPDQRPDQPRAPTTIFGDGRITVRWSPPANSGTDITKYVIEQSPGGPGSTVTLGRDAREWTFNGLTNGASYTYRIQAENGAGASDWSSWSAPEVPAGPPFQPAAPVAAGVNNDIGEQMSVQWTAPGDNGAPITTYSLVIIRAGVEIARPTFPAGGDTISTVVDVDNGVQYTYQVIATNKAGASQASAASTPVVAHGAPFAVTSFSVTDHDGSNHGFDGKVQYSLTPPNDNGMAIDHYEWDRNDDGAADASTTGSTGQVGSLANGTTYQVRVRACNDRCGPWSALSSPVTPYGRPNTPGANGGAAGQTQIDWSWSVPAANGRPIDRLEWRVDGGSWNVVDPAANGGQTLGGYGAGTSHTLTVRIFDSTGWDSAEASASVTTQQPTPPSLTISKGTSGSWPPTCTDAACGRIRVTMANFAPNTKYTISFTSNDGGTYPCTGVWSWFVDNTITTNASGAYSGEPGAVYGWYCSVRATAGGVTSNTYSWPRP